MKHLPKRVVRIALALIANVSFISFFYLLINIGQESIAEIVYWLFAPATISLGLLFFHFNNSYLRQSEQRLDKVLKVIPWLVLILVLIVELLAYFWSQSVSIIMIRVYIGYYLLSAAFPIYNIIIIFRSAYWVRKTERENKEVYATDAVNDLNWSKVSLLIYVLFIVGMIASVAFDGSFSEIIFNLSLLMLILYIGYYELRKISSYLKVIRIPENDGIDNQMQAERVGQDNAPISNLDKAKPDLFLKVDTLIDDNQLFLNMDISISVLSKKMEINGKYISQCINANAGVNFNGYINLKRLNFAKEMMLKGAFTSLSIEGIARESGFRSKSTFNSAFKRMNQCTPSEFIARINNDN